MNSEISNMKILSGDAQSFNQMEVMRKLEMQSKEKYDEFKKRIEKFEDVSTIEEAKELAKQILPVANEKNIFKVGNGKCTIVNTEDVFRICLDSSEEFIAYDFAK